MIVEALRATARPDALRICGDSVEGPIQLRLVPFPKRFDTMLDDTGRWGMTTLADVARHAGVASSTVSYVLSGKRSVSEETRERVRRAVESLGYHPHVGARALASSRSN